MKRPTDYSLYLIFFVTAGLFLALIPLIPNRFFDPDEFEHSHAAWCVFRGMLPYKDFFEHHTPWYYYLLSPLFYCFDVARSVDSARHFLLFGRGLSLVLTAVSVFLLSRIGRLWERRKVGLLAGLLLVGQPMFFPKAIEMRPDVLALPLFLGCLWCLLRGLARSSDSATKSLRYFLGGGLSLGAAIMCTQKMLFVLPGALAGLFIGSLPDERGGRAFAGFVSRIRAVARSQMLMTSVFLVSVLVPAGLTWAAFALHHAGGDFITNNFLLNARWKPAETGQLRRLISTSWPILALCLLGGGISLARFFRCQGRQPGGILLLFTLVGLFIGALIIPVAQSQYYLIPLPLVSLFAAQGLLFLIERVPRHVQPVFLVIALVPLGVLQARALRNSYERRNDEQLVRLRYVFENTHPEDVVMDGWQGLGVFRPHAFHYFFLHRETLAMLPDALLATYLDALERGRIRPRLIAMDRSLAALGPRFQSFVEHNYRTTDGLFYFRNGFSRARPGGGYASLRASED